MSVITINLEQGIALLDGLVEEKGADFVYTGPCTYERGGLPDCLIGQALAKAGVPIRTLRKMDSLDWSSEDAHGQKVHTGTDISTIAASSQFDGEFVLEEEALVLFAEAQRRQDLQQTWGEAVESAKAYASEDAT